MEQYEIVEYPLILTFIIIGSIFLIASSDIVSLFLSVELQSYGLYLLCTIYRNSELATSAGLMYFLLGGLSSCIILLGTTLLYINSGTTNLDYYSVINSITTISLQNKESYLIFYNIDYVNLSLLIMSIGFLFKISAAPFHFWSPEVYDSIPTIVTTFVAIIGKISIFVFILQLSLNFAEINNSNIDTHVKWNYTFLISSLLSLIIGTILGLNQFKIKKLLAYSTISHIGFILLALTINSMESTSAFIFYIIQYSFTNLNSFLLLLSIGYSLYLYTDNSKQYKYLLDKNNSSIQLTSQLKGLFFINPLLAVSLSITMFSLVGIPPLMGFFGKQMILSAALDKGYLFITIIAVLTSVISAVYYLNIIKQMFFEESLYNKNIDIKSQILSNSKYNNDTLLAINNITLSTSLSISISTITLILLTYIINPEELLSISNLLALITVKY